MIYDEIDSYQGLQAVKSILFGVWPPGEWGRLSWAPTTEITRWTLTWSIMAFQFENVLQRHKHIIILSISKLRFCVSDACCSILTACWVIRGACCCLTAASCWIRLCRLDRVMSSSRTSTITPPGPQRLYLEEKPLDRNLSIYVYVQGIMSCLTTSFPRNDYLGASPSQAPETSQQARRMESGGWVEIMRLGVKLRGRIFTETRFCTLYDFFSLPEEEEIYRNLVHLLSMNIWIIPDRYLSPKINMLKKIWFMIYIKLLSTNIKKSLYVSTYWRMQ